MAQLPDVNDDEMWCVQIQHEGWAENQYLLLQDDYDSAIEVFDMEFMRRHNLDTPDAEPGKKIVLLSPVTPSGSRAVVAEIVL